MAVLSEVVAIFRDIVLAIFDSLLGRSHRRLTHSVFIRAPREEVWRAITHSGTLSGGMPVQYRIDPLPHEEALFRVSLALDDNRIQSVIRLVDAREEEAFLAEHLPIDPDSQYVPGDEHYFGTVLKEVDGGTELTHFDELEFNGFMQRIFYPLFVRGMLQRLKITCELEGEPEVQEEPAEASIWGAVSAGFATTFIWYFYGINWAMVFLAALMLHEYGHVLAMKMLGRPVREFYVFPFSSGVEPDESKFRNWLDKSFCSLMGPAFSLIPSFALYIAYLLTENAVFGAAAALFAVINLVNLLPIFPLDGGQVLKAVTRSLRQDDTVTMGWAVLVVGLACSLAMESFVAASLVSFVSFQLWTFAEEEEDAAKPLSTTAITLVAGSALVTAVLYGNILVTTISDPKVMSLFALA